MSGKKQSEQLNLNKVKIINKLLDKVLILLKNELTIEFLQKLDEDDLPTNSDAVLILSQSLSAMDQFHSSISILMNGKHSIQENGRQKMMMRSKSSLYAQIIFSCA